MHKYATLAVTAAVQIPRDASKATLRAIAKRHQFDFEPRQGFLYVRSRAISSRTNDNYDEFPASEIKKAYRSFIGKPVFVNHVNDDHRRARGVIIDAALHEDTLHDGSPDTWAEVLMEVDAKRFPKLAKAILAGRIDRTSMGCDVAYSICSACGNKASTPAEYCAHIPRLKGKKIERRNAATGSKETHLIRETCYGLGFFENSLLVEEPADPTAMTWDVQLGDDLLRDRHMAPRAASLDGSDGRGADSVLSSDVGQRELASSGLASTARRQGEQVALDHEHQHFASAEEDAQDCSCGEPDLPKSHTHGQHMAWEMSLPCQGGHCQTYPEPHSSSEHFEKNKANGLDAWGNPLHQPYDGHGAFSCNNHACTEHPQEMYEHGRGPAGMPGWMQHDLDPDKDVKREVGKTFHDLGMTEDGRYLLDQQHTGPSKFSLLQHFASDQPNLWPKHPVFRSGDRVVETMSNGDQYGATVNHQEESDSPDHPGTVWVTDDERAARYGDKPSLEGVHPKRLSIHPDAPAEQHQWHAQQKAKNDAGVPYVPEAERDIDENDRETVHHLTDKHDFKPDTTFRPENNTTMGGSLSPRLFVGRNASSWAEHPDYGYRRPYVAEVDAPKKAIQWGGYNGEGEIHGRHFDKVNVKRVLPYDEYEKEQDDRNYKSPVDARDWSESQHREHLKKWRNHLHENHNWGWNEFDRNHNHTGVPDEDRDEEGMPIRRDRKGKPMTQYRSMLVRHFADAKVIPFPQCACDEPDIYDGYAECPVHPDGQHTSAKKDSGPSVSGVVLKAADTGRVLMLQRGLDDEKDPAAGTWEFPGGHHEPGDTTSLHAGIREWEEEVGQPFPEGGYVAHTWQSPNGIYQGHVIVIPSEKDVTLHDGRVMPNPDDPKGDKAEQAAWWDPEHAKKNPALRTEVKSAPWAMVKKASSDILYHATPHDLTGKTHLLPPAKTGVEPNWEGMDESENHQVFMSRSLEQAHGWGSEFQTPYRIYAVHPEGDVDHAVHGSTASSARIVREVYPGITAEAAKHHHKKHHHHRDKASHPHYSPNSGWRGGWGAVGWFGHSMGYCCPGGSCAGVNTIEGTDGAAGGSVGDAGGSGDGGGGDGGGGATARRRTAALSTTWDLDPEHTQQTTRRVRDLPYPNPMQSSVKDVAKIRRRLRNTGYQHDASAPITVLKHDGGREELIDGNHRVEALITAGGFLDHEVPVLETTKDPRPSRRTAGAYDDDVIKSHETCSECGKPANHIHLPAHVQDELRAVVDARDMQNEMHQHGQQRVVDLSDPTDLKQHMLEAHDCDESDFWRNSHPSDHPALGPSGSDDRPLTHMEVHRLHDHDHGTGEYSGTTMGSSHFHTAVRKTSSWMGDHMGSGFLRKDASLRKQADDDQCPYCAGDSLMSQGSYTCEDGHTWRPDEPAAKAFHEGPGELQPITSMLVRHFAAIVGDGQNWAKPAGQYPIDFENFDEHNHGVKKEDGPFHLTRDPETRAHHVVDHQNRVITSSPGSDGSNSEHWDASGHTRDLFHTLNQIHGFHEPLDHTSPNNLQEAADRETADTVPFEHSKTDPRIPGLKARPAAPVRAPEGSHSPHDEWHGPYEVVQHPETKQFHVVDNQNRPANGHWSATRNDGKEHQYEAEAQRDDVDRRTQGREHAKGIADSLFKAMNDIADPGGTDESRKSDRNISRMNELGMRYEGGPQHPLHPGKFGADDVEKKGDGDGEPYYEVKDPGGSGYKARDYGGNRIHIHHEATGDEGVDSPSTSGGTQGGWSEPATKRPGFDHDSLHEELHHWIHGDPADGDDAYGAGADYARNDPRIERWQKRNGYKG